MTNRFDIKIGFSELGQGLKDIRGGEKLADFGRRMELTASHICEIEKGQKIPSLNVVARYAQVNEGKINLVFGGDEK